MNEFQQAYKVAWTSKQDLGDALITAGHHVNTNCSGGDDVYTVDVSVVDGEWVVTLYVEPDEDS